MGLVLASEDADLLYKDVETMYKWTSAGAQGVQEQASKGRLKQLGAPKAGDEVSAAQISWLMEKVTYSNFIKESWWDKCIKHRLVEKQAKASNKSRGILEDEVLEQTIDRGISLRH